MNDEDKQPSYERLDETNPERNRRSFFDWLRGKEESDEERLRRKLDEELKEAARQRAEQFEEERRSEEEREVAETKKLKKRWRAKLVEKSKRLLEETAASGEEPTSGYDIAKLMVAERIVKLHDMLQDESLDLRRSEVKALKINIDFMGLLSEKLDRPELEVPAEIEQLYQTIASSVEETTGETRPEPPRTSQETVPISETDTAYNTFAASIVQAIRRTLRPEPNPSGTVPDTQTARPQEQLTRQSPELSSPMSEAAKKLLGIVQETAMSGEDIRKELTGADTARRLADVVEKAAMLDEQPTRTRRKPQAYGISSVPIPNPEKPETTPEHGFDLPPNKKIKYLSELELFTLAKTVEIGSGRLLSDVYTKGEIDREGLIKILEKYDKGEDYRSEFVLRREKWQRQKAASPEYLGTPAPARTAAPVSREIRQEQSKAVGKQAASFARAPSPVTNSSEAPQKQRIISLSSASQLSEDIRGRLRRKSQLALLAGSLLLVVILFFVFLELTTR